MADGIRNLGGTPANIPQISNEVDLNSDLNETINDATNSLTNTVSTLKAPETKATNPTTTPLLGYGQIRDSYETAKGLPPQNTNTSVDSTAKSDPANISLLNQQLLSARLGTPLIGKQPVTSPGLADRSPSLTENTAGKISQRNVDNPEYIKFRETEFQYRKMRKLAEQIDALREEVSDLKATLRQLQYLLIDLEAQYAATKDPEVLSQITDLKEHMYRLKGEVETKNQEIERLEVEYASLKAAGSSLYKTE